MRIHMNEGVYWARICKRLWSPGIDSEESISPAYVACRAGTTNRVVEPSRQAGNRFLGSLKGLQIRALPADTCCCACRELNYQFSAAGCGQHMFAHTHPEPVVINDFITKTVRAAHVCTHTHPESVVINDFCAKTGAWEAAEQLLTQIAAFTLLPL
jgi:hypothetical protein